MKPYIDSKNPVELSSELASLLSTFFDEYVISSMLGGSTDARLSKITSSAGEEYIQWTG